MIETIIRFRIGHLNARQVVAIHVLTQTKTSKCDDAPISMSLQILLQIISRCETISSSSSALIENSHKIIYYFLEESIKRYQTMRLSSIQITSFFFYNRNGTELTVTLAKCFVADRKLRQDSKYKTLFFGQVGRCPATIAGPLGLICYRGSTPSYKSHPARLDHLTQLHPLQNDLAIV